MSDTGGADEWRGWDARIVEANVGVVEEFRANGGRVGGYFAGAPMLLLHHAGARSGRERVNPLVYLPDGDDMVVAATKGGAPENPDWYHNLKAHPRVVVEVGTGTCTVDAVEVIGEERDALYHRLARMRPAFAGYETRTGRVIPVFRLTRVPPPVQEERPLMSPSAAVTEQTRQFLIDWFARLAATGFDGGVFLDALADELVWTVTGSSPISGTFRGKQSYVDGVWRALDARLATWPRAVVQRLLADGEWAVVEFRGEGGVGRNGTDYTLQYCWVVRVVDRRIREVVGYYDQVKVAELFA